MTCNSVFVGNAARVVVVRLRRRVVVVARRCQVESHASLLGLNANPIRTFNLTFRAGIVGDFRCLVRSRLRSRIGGCRANLQEKSAGCGGSQLCNRTHLNPLRRGMPQPRSYSFRRTLYTHKTPGRKIIGPARNRQLVAAIRRERAGAKHRELMAILGLPQRNRDSAAWWRERPYAVRRSTSPARAPLALPSFTASSPLT